MKSIKRLSALLMCVALITINTITTFAATDMAVTTNSYQAQQGTKWCWAASCVSILSARGINTSQSSFVFSSTGSTANVGRDRSLTPSDLARYKVSAVYSVSTLSFSSIQSYVNANKPIYASIDWRIGGGHSVVISGWDKNQQTLKLMDPGIGWVYCSYSTFTTNYQNAGKWVSNTHL
ncbi:MAG: C39 family peptidase [Oscillospiraceae bacterium]|nr:C39 family peptidase [Oscillospiraceae bacterium]